MKTVLHLIYVLWTGEGMWGWVRPWLPWLFRIPVTFWVVQADLSNLLGAPESARLLRAWQSPGRATLGEVAPVLGAQVAAAPRWSDLPVGARIPASLGDRGHRDG